MELRSDEKFSYNSFLRYSPANLIELRVSTNWDSYRPDLGAKVIFRRDSGYTPGVSLVATLNPWSGITDVRLSATQKITKNLVTTTNIGSDTELYGILIFVHSLGNKAAAFVEGYVKKNYQ